jgi:hypothetical protein
MGKGWVAFVVLLTLRTLASAQSSGFGIGIIAGEPTGITAKQWVSHNNAFDIGLAWSFRRDGFFHVHADYLWHFPGSVRSSEQFVPYAGVGGRFGARKKDPLLGLRIVGGLAWWPKNTPIDLFVEIAPILDLAPATELSGNGGIGIRFFFK